MIFTPFPFISILLFLVGIADLFVAFLLVYKHKRSLVHILVSLLSVCLGLFNISISLMSSGYATPLMPLGFKGAAWAGSPLPFLFLLLSTIFPNKKISFSVIKIFILSLPMLFFASLSFSNLWFNSIIIKPDSITLELSSLFTNSYLLFFLIYFSWGIKNFYDTFKKSEGVTRLQCKYFLLGLLPTSAIGIFCNIILVYFKVGKLLYFGPLGSIFFVGFISYSILRHRLMDITVVIRKGLIYSTIVGLFTGIYIFAIFLLSFFFQRVTGYNSIITAAIVILAFALGFQPIKSKIQEYIDRIFFKSKYDYQKTLKDLSQTAGSTVGLDELLSQITKTVTKTLKVDQTSVYLLDKKKDLFIIKETEEREIPG